MTRRPILIYGAESLRRPAGPVGAVTGAVRALAEDLIETMYDAPGRGLAAPQVGESLRMLVVDCHWKDGAPRAPVVMIDPKLLNVSDEVVTHEEGCLSIPDLPMRITRPARIRVRWTDIAGAAHDGTFDGIEAVCIQHEYDHLDGILIPDRLPEAERAGFASALATLSERGGTW